MKIPSKESLRYQQYSRKGDYFYLFYHCNLFSPMKLPLQKYLGQRSANFQSVATHIFSFICFNNLSKVSLERKLSKAENDIQDRNLECLFSGVIHHALYYNNLPYLSMINLTGLYCGSVLKCYKYHSYISHHMGINLQQTTITIRWISPVNLSVIKSVQVIKILTCRLWTLKN